MSRICVECHVCDSRIIVVSTSAPEGSAFVYDDERQYSRVRQQQQWEHRSTLYMYPVNHCFSADCINPQWTTQLTLRDVAQSARNSLTHGDEYTVQHYTTSLSVNELHANTNANLRHYISDRTVCESRQSSSLVDRNRAFKQRATEYWLYMLTYIHGMRLLEAGWSWLQ